MAKWKEDKASDGSGLPVDLAEWWPEKWATNDEPAVLDKMQGRDDPTEDRWSAWMAVSRGRLIAARAEWAKRNGLSVDDLPPLGAPRWS